MSGGKFLVTLHLVRHRDGEYLMPHNSIYLGVTGDHWLKPGEHIVSVEPAPRLLPMALGSLILAKVETFGQGVYLLELVREMAPALGAEPKIVWCIRGAGDWIPPQDIGADWVQIDPTTSRPVEEES